jgi:CHAT domain-containing protein
MDTDAPDRVAAGLLASERGRAQALLDAITEHARMSAAPPDLLSRQREIQRKLNWLSLRLASGAEAEEAGLRRQVQLLLAENQETEARLRQAAAPGALDRQALSLAHLRAALPDDCALVEYHLGTRRSYLWMLDHQQLRVFPLPRRAAVEAQVSRAAGLFGNILERRRSPSQQQSFEAAMRDLSATLLGPLQGNKLPPCVVVAPDGPLHSAPFAALREPSGGQPLGLSRELIQIPAAAYLVKGKEPRPVSRFPKAILAIADPVFSRDDPRVTRKSGNRRQPDAPDLARLPFADELNTITRLLPDSRRRILRGFEATPDALRNARLADYGILHFSTHALIDNEIPEMSRIALSLVDSEGNAANGFLEPYELAQWRLEGSTVALSACETALGKQVLGEGMAGLASSLFYAGAARLIATLAKVDDEASSEFFGEVYSRLLAPQPVRLETALALARRRLSQSPRWADPYYWASFVLMGRPSL